MLKCGVEIITEEPRVWAWKEKKDMKELGDIYTLINIEEVSATGGKFKKNNY